ncbi:uncharacterized protein [Bombus flavifrons]|uniref:uncharacterized protein n=1 Tax=Bombus flavifrons TaxID=103934 RepID=UPI0037037174
MCLVGTVYGWKNTSVLRLTSGNGDVPPTVTSDEYSWSVSLTVLSSMIGSLVAAKLADRIGRKYCLLLCSTVFIFGWFEMYSATSVQNLYFARGVLGIGVGIARTINPMFVSEVTDIEYRGFVSVLIAANVYIESLLTYALEHSLTYTSHLLALIVISGISILPLMCLRETPYFLVAKGQKAEARKSIAYYKGIEDPERVKIELRALREEVRYGLHQQSRSDLSSQSGSDLHPPYRSNVPPPYSINLPPPSSSDLPPPYSSVLPPPYSSVLPQPYSINLPPPSSSDLPPPYSINFSSPSSTDLPPPYRSNLPSQSIRETHSDPTQEVVGTEVTSDLHLPSSSDSPSESISSVYSKFKCEVNTQPTGELRVEYSRDSSGLPLKTARELHSQSTSESHRPSASEVHQPSTSGVHRPSTSEVHRPSTSEIHPPSSSEVHRPSTSELHRPSASEVHPPSTSEIHPPSSSEVHRPSTSELHRPSASEVHRPSTSEINPDHIRETQSRSRSDLRTQPNVDSRASTGISEPYMDGTTYTCLNKLRSILQGSNRRALLIMLVLIMAQHLSGNFITMRYLEVFSKTTIGIESNVATILVLAVDLISGTLSTLTVECLGRRKLLIVSTLGSCFTLTILATYLLLVQYNSDVSLDSTIPVFVLIIYQVMFQIGLGTLPNVLLCDLFPTKLKGFVGAIFVIFDGAIGFIASKVNEVITDNLEWHAIFFIFATSCSLAFLMVFIWVPETKGKTYHEIEALLAGENLISLNEDVRTDEMDISRI